MNCILLDFFAFLEETVRHYELDLTKFDETVSRNPFDLRTPITTPVWILGITVLNRVLNL